MQDLRRYLERIGFRGTPRADLATLRALHRRHLLAIPYENLDVQLDVPVTLDAGAAFSKLVEQRRGGWCYEMNGLFAWALDAVGFSFVRMAAGVMRAMRGDVAVGNHLALLVHLDEGAFLADVGFGDGALEPVPLRTGKVAQGAFEFSLEALEDGWWRFHNHPHGGAASFDFRGVPADEGLLARQCRWLQSAPESPFTQVAVVQRHLADGLAVLRGRVLRRITCNAVETREVASEAEYADLLHDVFALRGLDTARLWRRVERQHAAYLERLAAARLLAFSEADSRLP